LYFLHESKLEYNRYIRQELLQEIGELGQQKICKAHVAVVGCGGLGSIAASYLAGAGVGKLTLIDGDHPELSNLHRQVFFDLKKEGTKSQLMAQYIEKFNPQVETCVISEMLTKENINESLEYCDLVLECTDEIMCKYLVNDYCHLNKLPLVYAAIYKFDGYVSVFDNASVDSVHLRDIFPKPDLNVPSCSEVGVLNTIAGLIGIMQVNEAIKFIVNGKSNLTGQLLTYNCLSNEQLKLKLKKSWKEDLKSLYKTENYIATSCLIIPELELDIYTEASAEYDLVSILENHEHQALFPEVKHLPLSQFETNNWDSDKATIFYCKSGKRSASLVSQILDSNPKAKVFSLKGGINKYVN